MGSLRWATAMSSILAIASACDTHAPPAEPTEAPKPKAKPKPVASEEPEPDADTAPPDPKTLPKPPQPLPENEKDDKPQTNSRYLLDGLTEVGPAAPAAAFAHGVVMVTRSDELSISKLLQPPSKSKKPVAGALEETTRSAQEFWPIARGPALSATHAYWVSKGRVVRRALAGGELEVLTTDAREGTRVAVTGPPDVVAYITRPVGKQDSLARIRLPDGKKLDLTPEGAAASSVSLTRMGEDVIASYIDGRSGMTPVHARRLHSSSGTLDPDVVVWVSGATQGLTEIVSVGTNQGSWLMLPVERDVTHFGLATLALAPDPKNGSAAPLAHLRKRPRSLTYRGHDAVRGAERALRAANRRFARLASRIGAFCAHARRNGQLRTAGDGAWFRRCVGVSARRRRAIGLRGRSAHLGAAHSLQIVTSRGLHDGRGHE